MQLPRANPFGSSVGAENAATDRSCATVRRPQVDSDLQDVVLLLTTRGSASWHLGSYRFRQLPSGGESTLPCPSRPRARPKSFGDPKEWTDVSQMQRVKGDRKPRSTCKVRVAHMLSTYRMFSVAMHHACTRSAFRDDSQATSRK